MSTSSVQLVVWRQSAPDAEGRWETFTVDGSGAPTVQQALESINASPVLANGDTAEPVTLEEGEDFGLNVNGRPARSSEARLDGSEEIVVLEPLSVFPVIRDLTVDRSRFQTDLQEAGALAPTGFDVEALVSDCHRCGLCMEACNDYRRVGDYVGPAVVRVLERSNRAPGGDGLRSERLAILMGDRGIVHDQNTFSYADACPDGADLVQSIGLAKRSSAFQWIQDFFQN
jgi:succinate dehydrogenase / fumarate reductase iron-sulfur subunit